MRMALLLAAGSLAACGTTDDPPPAPPPGAPTAITATAQDTRILVTWEPSTDPDAAPVDHYDVIATPDWSHYLPGTCTSATNSCTVGNLENGTTYTVVARAVSATGDLAASPAAIATPLPALLASPMVSLWLDATALADGPVMQWSDRSGNGRDATAASPAAAPIAAADLAGRHGITFDGIDDQLVTGPVFDAQHGPTIFVAVANRDPAVPIAGHVSTALSTMSCDAEPSGLTLSTYSAFTDPDHRRIDFTDNPFVGYGLYVNSTNMIGELAPETWAVASVLMFPAPFGPTLSLGAYLGGCQFGHVAIGEVIVLDHVATTGELTVIEEYLANKWHVIRP